ncbi:hypothetical protein [Pseudidiomarina aquimaris]|uniref:hypothetical protein n=1 Tax=Pseudidiomarina aquimaris TaxID=641841 RepID=UPI003A96C5A3
MLRNIEVKLDEVKRVYKMMEQLHDLLHQPEKYRNRDVMESFVQEHYAELSELYYEIVWEWLPQDIQDEITDE